MAGAQRIYLETGQTWVFACSLDWPGWCRRGKGEEPAVEALLSYAPRYRTAVGSRFAAGDVEVVGRVDGDATTDFGAPSAIGAWDHEPLTAEETRRQVGILQAAWRAFDDGAAAAPASLRKGPRGGGRDTNQIVDHVREAERAFASRSGGRVPPRTPWADQRALIVETLSSPPAGAKWPARYALRRMAWHILDHLWEIEDRRA